MECTKQLVTNKREKIGPLKNAVPSMMNVLDELCTVSAIMKERKEYGLVKVKLVCGKGLIKQCQLKCVSLSPRGEWRGEGQEIKKSGRSIGQYRMEKGGIKGKEGKKGAGRKGGTRIPSPHTAFETSRNQCPSPHPFFHLPGVRVHE